MSSLTIDSMLRFFYGEMSPAEHAEFLITIEQNQAMMEQFEMLRQAIEMLGQLSYSPSEATTKSIFNYASQPAGY